MNFPYRIFEEIAITNDISLGEGCNKIPVVRVHHVAFAIDYDDYWCVRRILKLLLIFLRDPRRAFSMTIPCLNT